tara:strand:+ start:30787 stop:32151 length:1365 start_codon:yes stop_codon:yes gene_type:complete
MNKTSLIIQREYLTRVKKKSFIIMSIVGPILIAALMVVPAWLAIQDEDSQLVEVIDETGLFVNQLKNSDEITFAYEFRSLKAAQDDLKEKGKYTAVLHIPKVVVTLPKTVQLFYDSKPKSSSISYMENEIAKVIENKKLQDMYNLSVDQISGLRPPVKITSNKLKDLSDQAADGEAFEKTAGGLATGVGFVLAFFIYMFIFLFGVQVMRGVIEEKTNRIVEVIISSVKPFQLMMGKIIGVALVAITQVLIWVVLSTVIIGGVQSFFKDDLMASKKQDLKKMEQFNPALEEEGQQIEESKGQSMMQEINTKLQQINFPLVIACFIFYFLGGYLLYGSLFAAIGAAVDSEADTQQFMFPITVPLIIALAIAQVVLDNPDGSLAFWASIIPFTSPIIMMIRIPVGVHYLELLLSMGILIITFIGTTWMAGRIYRTGILMYGKKVNFKELGKWLFHKS